MQLAAWAESRHLGLIAWENVAWLVLAREKHGIMGHVAWEKCSCASLIT